MHYVIRGLHCFREADDWQRGCIGPATAYHIDCAFQGATTAETIGAVARFLDVDDDAIDRNACDETGRIDFARTETDNGETLTAAEVDRWKAGKLRAWYCIYTGFLEQAERVRA